MAGSAWQCQSPFRSAGPLLSQTQNKERSRERAHQVGVIHPGFFFFLHSTEWNTFLCMHVAPSILLCVSTEEQRARRQFLLDNFSFSSCVVVGFVCSQQLRLQSRRSGPKTRCDYFHTLFLADGGFFVCRNRKKWIQMRKWPGTGP